MSYLTEVFDANVQTMFYPSRKPFAKKQKKKHKKKTQTQTNKNKQTHEHANTKCLLNYYFQT